MINRSHAPLFATVNITTHCNLDCDYCFMQPRSNLNMLLEDFEAVIQELKSQQVFFINISGGEPFCHPLIGEFLDIAYSAFKHVMVLSNGTILTEAHKHAIRKVLRAGGAYTTQISLDAIDVFTNEKTRGQTNLVLKNIEHLSKLGADVIIATVVNRYNMGSIENMITYLEPYTRHFHLMTVQDVRSVDGVEERLKISHNDENQLWENMRKLAKKRNLYINTPLNYEGEFGCASGAPCMAAFTHLVIDPDLKVRPCDRLTDVYIGDFKTQSIQDIWHGDQVKPILQGRVPFCRRKYKQLA
jgi:MoaA/NifB/PqqE/SkfB family radical SAM enzyme